MYVCMYVYKVCTYTYMHAWTDVLVDGWMDVLVDGWMDGWMHGCMDGWMDGWMDGRMADGWVLTFQRCFGIMILFFLTLPGSAIQGQ